jgi:DNA-directed RNA polymerase subunit F
MAVLYVVSTNVAEKVAELQANDFENTYVSRETISHFDKIKATDEQKAEAIKDIMSICDAVVLVGRENPRMAVELNFAKLIGMEIIKVNENTASI